MKLFANLFFIQFFFLRIKKDNFFNEKLSFLHKELDCFYPDNFNLFSPVPLMQRTGVCPRDGDWVSTSTVASATSIAPSNRLPGNGLPVIHFPPAGR